MHTRAAQRQAAVQVVLHLVLLLQQASAADPVQCKEQLDSCTCRTASNKYISLKPLAKHDGKFAFDKVQGDDSFRYSYNPCAPAKCADSLDAAVCQAGLLGSNVLLGTQSSAKFVSQPDTGQLSLTYSAEGKLGQTTVSVVLQCVEGQDSAMTAKGQVSSFGTALKYQMTLTSKYACEVDSLPGQKLGPSLGDILLIIFFSVLLVYLAAGVAINRFYLQKSIGIDLIPNIGFWLQIPGLVREGCVFTFVKLRSCVSRNPAYQQI